jgi:hypothetical protein
MIVFSLLVVTALLFTTVQCSVLIHLIEHDDNVEMTLSGSLALTGAPIGSASSSTRLFPSAGAVSVVQSSVSLYEIDTVTPFGTGTSVVWDVSSGSPFSLLQAGALSLSTSPLVGVPTGYTNGDELSSTATLFNTDFATLGCSTGVFGSGGQGSFTAGNTITVFGRLSRVSCLSALVTSTNQAIVLYAHS